MEKNNELYEMWPDPEAEKVGQSGPGTNISGYATNRDLTATANGDVYTSRIKPIAREMVVLTAIPRGMLDGLPEEDQEAIKEIVGNQSCWAELVFKGRDGQPHFLFVAPGFIK